MGTKFTPKNLLRNIKTLGPWSSYSLAETALAHYFPDLFYDENGEYISMDVEDEIKLMDKLGCKYWEDAIVKYHTEVGYKENELNNENVNEY